MTSSSDEREAREREATAVAVDESGRRGRARGDAGARGDAVDAVYTTAKRQMRVTEASMTLAQKRGAAAKK